MRKFGLALLACLLAAPAHAYRIIDDDGGRIKEYLETYERVGYSGDKVEIAGNCLSACTLVLAFVPPERICVTKRAVLGFHAAWRPGNRGKPEYSAEGTQLLLDKYPAAINQLINERGGLKAKMFFVHGPTLRSMFQLCRK